MSIQIHLKTEPVGWSGFLVCAFASFLVVPGCNGLGGGADAPHPATAALEALGAKVTTNGAGEVVKIIARGEEFTDEHMEAIGKLSNLTSLDLYGTTITDAGLKKLSGLTKLTKLFIHQADIQDWTSLKSLVNLEELSLQGSKIDDAGLEHLANLTKLKMLNLAETAVTGSGLDHLQSLEQLERLYLQGTPGPDDGSDYRRRIQADSEHFLDLDGRSDAQIAERIAADGIDILVDIGGYSANSRPSVLLMRPAPVLVHYLGFPGTHGGLVDYVVTDPVLTPPEVNCATSFPKR